MSFPEIMEQFNKWDALYNKFALRYYDLCTKTPTKGQQKHLAYLRTQRNYWADLATRKVGF